MSCNFHVGQKVEFVGNFGTNVERAARQGVTLPVKGAVYTIRNLEPGVRRPSDVYLRLNEIVNGPHVEDGIEPSFLASFFRPVVTRKTDISIFKAMLNPSKQRINA